MDQEEIKPSQIKFRDGNLMEFDMGFGCGLFVYTGRYSEDSTKLADKDWKNWRSFYFHGSGFTKLSFVEDKTFHRVKALVEDGKLTIN